jgi:hypothetical protein
VSEIAGHLPEIILSGGFVGAMRTVLGPASHEAGEALRRWTAYRVGNVERVVENAAGKIANPDSPGSVSTRVAMHVLEEGSCSDDPVIIEYLGGILAGSRSPDGADDRGAAWVALIGRLTSDALRLHYLLYTGLRAAYIGTDAHLRTSQQRESTSVYICMSDFEPAFASEPRYFDAIEVLNREGLIHNWCSGRPEGHPGLMIPRPGESGFYFQPTVDGAQLLLWAHGLANHQVDDIFASDVALPPIDGISPPTTARRAVIQAEPTGD